MLIVCFSWLKRSQELLISKAQRRKVLINPISYKNQFTTKEDANIYHRNESLSYYKLLPYIGSYSNSINKNINYWLCKTILQKCKCFNCFFIIKIEGHIFSKILFAICSIDLCCVQTYLCSMSILLIWRNQVPFTNKD